MSWREEVEELERRRKMARQQGGDESVQRHHQRGKLSIRERIDNFLDHHSFREQGKIAGGATLDDDLKALSFAPANYVLGVGRVNKRFTAVVSVVVFVVLDAWVLVVAMGDLREGYWAIPKTPDTEAQPYLVEVLVQQWAWNFRATGPDVEFGTGDDILSLNELTLPLDRPVVFNINTVYLYVPLPCFILDEQAFGGKWVSIYIHVFLLQKESTHFIAALEYRYDDGFHVHHTTYDRAGGARSLDVVYRYDVIGATGKSNNTGVFRTRIIDFY